jgi:tripartite-type tricarboxylate transporter receptor subunit TctC
LRGLAAPKGLPSAVREKLLKAVAQAASDPEYLKKAADMFAPTRFLAPAAYAAELKANEAEFRQLWKEMPWQE